MSREYRLTHEQLTVLANAIARLPWAEADPAMQIVKAIARQPLAAANGAAEPARKEETQP